MSAPPVDQAVREEIRTALEVNLCVEAGAGTGKTTALVERIVEVLASGTADVDGVAVITFTEKAAAELSARVRERLEDALEGEPDPERRERLGEAARSLYRARIETIHSFAAGLLRQRPVEAGVDPGFGVMTDLEAGLAFDSAYDRWLAELMEGEHPEVRRALNLGFEMPEIRETAETLHRNRFLVPLAAFHAPRPETHAVIDWLERNGDELRRIEGSCENEGDRGLAGVGALIRFAERCRAEGDTEEARERLVARTSPAPAANLGSRDSWADAADCVRMKELMREYRELRDRVCLELRSVALLGVLPHAERFVRRFEDERRREGVADFDDLLIWTRDLLRDRLEVRRYFQRRFARLMIDEFQDTDPIQVEIAYYLTSDGQEATDWRGLQPAAGKLFVVGDPKQSIYRFRRADIAIYDEVKAGPLAGGVRRIRQNFRSVPGVIEWLNGVFDALLVAEEGVQPGNVALEPSLPRVEGAPAPVVVLRGGAGDEPADPLREKEARAVAALLRRVVEEEERWPVRDRATGEPRPPEWRDVAILLPARTGLESFEEALAEAGIPFRHEGSRDYFKRQEVRELIAVLRSIDDPTDRFSLVGALRSSAFGCSDQDIVVHRATGGAMDYRAPDADSDSPPVTDAYSVLLELHRARGRTSLPELVQRVAEASRLVETALLLPDGAQAAANLLAIVDQARAFSAAGGGGLRAFTRWLSDSTENEATEVDAGIAEEADDVVRLLTMHGAKGLEFPIVVTANLGNRASNPREPVPDEGARQLHFHVGSGGRTGHYPTPGYAERWEAEKATREAERLRVLYVAATRARDHLIIPWFRGRESKPGPLLAALEPLLSDGEGDAWLLDAEALPEAADRRGEREMSTAPPEAVEAATARRAAWTDDHDALIGAARHELPQTVASSVERSSRPLAAEASHSESTLLVSEGPPLPVGDAVHLVMERVALPGAHDLEAVTASVCAEADLLDRRREVAGMARRCVESATVRRAIASRSHRREVPFTIPYDGGFATGRVDLVFREDRGDLVVVDYKTDEVAADGCEAHARKHHSGQADVYARAIGTATGVPVGKVVFVFCRPGVEVALSPAS